MRYLLDTSAILAHYRQEAGWQEVQTLFETEDAEIFWSVVSLAEFGRRLKTLGAKEADILFVMDTYALLFTEIIEVDPAIAKLAFVMGCRTPQRLPLIDALIAATAAGQQAILVHRDDHMTAIPAELLQQRILAAKQNDGHTA